MFGAVFGDIIGSYYEFYPTKDYHFSLHPASSFTDDSLMTAAVCRAILNNDDDINSFGLKKRAYEYAVQYKRYYSLCPTAGFGQMFSAWASSKEMYRQNSYANGGAMRAVPIGYAYHTLEQVMLQAKASCLYTHDHPDAIKGAQAVAVAVFLARSGESKASIKEYLSKKFRYALDRTIDEIRPHYQFDCKASYSVPPAIIAFLESEDYESAVRNAVSLGGDADTMACIAGGIAEAYYHEIPQSIASFCRSRIDSAIYSTVKEFEQKYQVQA
ncbi:MAG: ADP-ribosylglycohydrolase family protein [Ruminococcus sp.]|nr:ADP-ribosylglycohydrolase family protein [Ruminococcus sp.]